jgi:hypothetical protein
MGSAAVEIFQLSFPHRSLQKKETEKINFLLDVATANKKEETEKINFLLDVATAKSFLWAWRKFGGLLPGRIRKRNLPYITALHGSWTSVLLLGRMIRSSSAFTCA